jgi:hypothetical protein
MPVVSMIGRFAYATNDEIRRLLSRPEEVGAFLDQQEEAPDRRAMDVEKDWHALHWLLTGAEYDGEPPLNFIIMGGTRIGDVDVGYAPPRAFTSAQVNIINWALSRISAAELLDKYDGEAMRGLYPSNVWSRPDERDINIHSLAVRFDELKGFIARSAEQGLGLIVYVD